MGRLMEGVLAAFAQFDNDVRDRIEPKPTCSRRWRLGAGRSCADGYLNAPRQFGTSLMPDPERAPLVRRAFEEFALGTLHQTRGARERDAVWAANGRGAEHQCANVRHDAGESPSTPASASSTSQRRRERDDFEPLIDEAIFHKAQALRSGRISVTSLVNGTGRTFLFAASGAARPRTRPDRKLFEGPQRSLRLPPLPWWQVPCGRRICRPAAREHSLRTRQSPAPHVDKALSR